MQLVDGTATLAAFAGRNTMRIASCILFAAAAACGGQQRGTGSDGGARPIFVEGVLAPQEVANNEQCTFTSATTQPHLSSGVLDLDFRQQYDPVYLIGNRLAQDADASAEFEPSTVSLQGAVVRIVDANGNQLRTFTRLAAATVWPATRGVPGFAPMGVTTIDRETIMNDAAIQSQIVDAPAGVARVRLVTYVRVFGGTLGGAEVESDEFAFPVDVCRGCLITFAPADISPLYAAPNCAGNPAGAGTPVPTSLPCVVGQDLPIDCSQCQDVPDCHGTLGGAADAGNG
jgi:hypothetical protein